jgi:hypothetical protein
MGLSDYWMHPWWHAAAGFAATAFRWASHAASSSRSLHILQRYASTWKKYFSCRHQLIVAAFVPVSK